MGEVRLDRVLERLAVTLRGRGEDDEALLGRFITHRDEAAFAALLARHGPMVLGARNLTIKGGLSFGVEKPVQ